MSAKPFSHNDLVIAVWYRTLTRREQNPALAHHTEQSLLRCVAMVLTPEGVSTLVSTNPELREQFADTVAWWRTETTQQAEG